MMENYKCVIVANGLFPSGELALKILSQAEYVIACDGAVVHLEQHGIVPDMIVGDLDSLPEEFSVRYADRLYQVREQETNDLTKAVRYAGEKGIREVLILGATGLREDHTLGNISLLMQYAPDFDRIEILSDYGLFTPLLKDATLACRPGQQVSLFSLYPHGIISTSGLRYPIRKRRLLYWWEATLNEALGETFSVILEEGAKLIVYRQM
ncbi:thiamine diphosphokinase [uncultured Sanguibacteroides sp.]|uniref:thiamine diphosphokinase n=1 Tax=uncultured Sanguibacteroides sp. TaxID=1635151 RepID=UPI0025E4FD92|nr:thiamine diphosphokinase [uncultured Sanguibacteroides sp.]